MEKEKKKENVSNYPVLTFTQSYLLSMFSNWKTTSDHKNYLVTFRIFKEHSTTNGLFNYTYFASSKQDPCEELIHDLKYYIGFSET